jgi:hypothetical protein
VLRGLATGCGAVARAPCRVSRVFDIHSIERLVQATQSIIDSRLDKPLLTMRHRPIVFARGLDVGSCVFVAANRAAVMRGWARLTNHPGVTSPTSSLSPTLRAQTARHALIIS